MADPQDTPRRDPYADVGRFVEPGRTLTITAEIFRQDEQLTTFRTRGSVDGQTAVARVRDDYLGMTFMDTLSLISVDGKWQIYNKLFHVEGPAQS